MPVEAMRKSSPAGYAKGRARRELIVRVANQQFAERGFTGATILDIAAACDISRAGLLHHFADKEALLEAVLEQRDREDQQRFEPYIGIKGGVGILRAMIDLADHNRLTPGLIELFVRLSTESIAPDHPAHEYFIERYERIRSGTARALRAAARARYLQEGIDTEAAALRLTALMDGLQSMWLRDRRIDMSQQIRDEITQLLTAPGRAALDRVELALDRAERR